MAYLKLNKEMIKTITDALYIGSSRNAASKYAGITEQTFYNWMQLGKKASEKIGRKTKVEQLFLSFFTEVIRSEAEMLIKYQSTVDKAAERDPAWAYKMLQHRDGANYRNNDVSFSYDLTQATDEQLERIANGETPLAVMAGSSAGASTPEAAQEPTDE